MYIRIYIYIYIYYTWMEPRRSAAIPPNELSRQNVGKLWQHVTNYCKLWQHVRT